MLDTTSLQVSYVMLMSIVLVMSYGITYRTNRTAYAGWWCVSVAMFLSGAFAYMLIGTSHQVWANPLGNVLVITGGGCVWAASRSLRGRRLPPWAVFAAPTVVGVMSALDDPGDKLWPAGGWFLGAVWILLAISAWELWHAARSARVTGRADDHGYHRSLWALFLGCGAVALLYAGRWVTYLAVGPDEPPFTTVFGGEVSTLALTGLLAMISFTMTTLSEEQQKLALRDVAARDPLTGLLNRRGFVRLAETELRGGGGGQLILADLDHFKRINDEHGHAAGDRALVAFAETCRALVRETDVVGRHGGEEFVLLLPGAGPDRAAEVVASISAAMAERSRLGSTVLPTASYGIAVAELPLEDAIERADQALYRAKETGRDRAVQYADLA